MADDRAHSSGEPSDPPTQSELAQTPAPSTSPQSTGRGSLVVGDDIVRSATPWINSTGAKIAAVVGAGLLGGLVALGVTGNIPNPFDGANSDRVGSMPDPLPRTPIETADPDTFYLDFDSARNLGYTDDERVEWCDSALEPIEASVFARLQDKLAQRSQASLLSLEKHSVNQSAQSVVYTDRSVVSAAALWAPTGDEGEKLLACGLDNGHPGLAMGRSTVRSVHLLSSPTDEIPEIHSVPGNANVYARTGAFVDDVSPTTTDPQTGLPERTASVKSSATLVTVQELERFVAGKRWVAQSYQEPGQPGWDTDLLQPS